MRRIIIAMPAREIVATMVSAIMCLGSNAIRADVRVHYGEPLDPATHGPFVIETVGQMLARERANPPDRSPETSRHGVWIVPSRRATSFPHSGDHNVINKWGDTRMGIAFPNPVDVRGAFFSGQAAQGAWTTGVRAIGFRDGQVVAKADWFCRLGNQPAWYAMNLDNVDRIEIVSTPVLRGGGWYGMDDLTFSPTRNAQPGVTEPTVLDFEDLPYRTVLTGSGYAGLTWETGTGMFEIEPAIHHPAVPPGYREDEPTLGDESVTGRGGGGTLPQLVMDFRGVIRGDAGAFSFPPDTDGAIGPNHYSS